MAFPTTPANADTHRVGSVTWSYNSTTDIWSVVKATGSGGGGVTAFLRSATSSGLGVITAATGTDLENVNQILLDDVKITVAAGSIYSTYALQYRLSSDNGTSWGSYIPLASVSDMDGTSDAEFSRLIDMSGHNAIEYSTYWLNGGTGSSGSLSFTELHLKTGSGGSVPAGTIIYHAANTPPTNFLKADGTAVSRTTYAALFAAIGTTFGVGDGSTTFNVPDLRGEFMRGWDDSRGIDNGRSFGSAQADEIKAHTHNYTDGTNGTNPTGTGAGTNNSFPVVNGRATSETGGAETRPRNIAFLACIKY